MDKFSDIKMFWYVLIVFEAYKNSRFSTTTKVHFEKFKKDSSLSIPNLYLPYTITGLL